MSGVNKLALTKVAVRIAIWILIGALAAVGLNTETIMQVLSNIGMAETEVIVSTIVLAAGNLGFYVKDKLAKGET